MARVAEWLTPSLSLFIQVYKWVPVTYFWGITLRWTSILSGGSSNTPRCSTPMKLGQAPAVWTFGLHGPSLTSNKTPSSRNFCHNSSFTTLHFATKAVASGHSATVSEVSWLIAITLFRQPFCENLLSICIT